MAEQKQLNIDELKDDIKKPITYFADQLTKKLEDNFQGLSLIGSCLTDDYIPGKSDINTVLITNHINAALLETISAMGTNMGKLHLRAPLLMTAEYIKRSLDVFGIEFLDFQLTHKTVLGPDPFSELEFKKSDVRLQCERELKAALIKLRQGFISSVNDRKILSSLLGSAANSLLPIIRATLWLKNIERPRSVAETINACSQSLSVDLSIIANARQLRHDKTLPASDELMRIFDSLYSCVDKVSETVDSLEV